jgi:glycosyltransferase involved in cell wall biosynthesis
MNAIERFFDIEQLRPDLRRCVCIFSHSYLDRENCKNIEALRRHHDVVVILPRTGLNSLRQKNALEWSALRRPGVMSFRSIWLGSGQFMLASVTLGLKAAKPDVIVLEYNPWSLMFLQVWLALTITRCRAKVVCVVKKNTYRKYRGMLGAIKSHLATLTLWRTDHIVFVSEKARRLFVDKLEFPREHTSLCPQFGVDIWAFKSPRYRQNMPDKRAYFRVGFCGRFDDDKGIMDLVEAIRLVRKNTGLNVLLELTGTGPLLAQLRDLEQVHSWLSYRGLAPRKEMPDVLGRLDIFVMASKPLPDHEEHDAQALIEAMSMGLPCVATRVGIIPEIFVGGAGVLVHPSEPLWLAEAIADLLTKPSRMHSLGQCARERVCKNWSLEAVALRKAELIRALILSTNRR